MRPGYNLEIFNFFFFFRAANLLRGGYFWDFGHDGKSTTTTGGLSLSLSASGTLGIATVIPEKKEREERKKKKKRDRITRFMPEDHYFNCENEHLFCWQPDKTACCVWAGSSRHWGLAQRQAHSVRKCLKETGRILWTPYIYICARVTKDCVIWPHLVHNGMPNPTTKRGVPVGDRKIGWQKSPETDVRILAAFSWESAPQHTQREAEISLE